MSNLWTIILGNPYGGQLYCTVGRITKRPSCSCLVVCLWTVAVPLGVLKGSDCKINYSDRSAALTSTFYLRQYVVAIEKTNTPLCIHRNTTFHPVCSSWFWSSMENYKCNDCAAWHFISVLVAAFYPNSLDVKDNGVVLVQLLPELYSITLPFH